MKSFKEKSVPYLSQKSLILERRLCLALAGLSLQIKIALVGSGRRSEDFRGPILSECRGCFTLQIDRFTMGGVKMINHRGKNRQNLKIQISSYHKRNLEQNLKKISWRRVWLHSTVPVTTTSRENEMRKGKRNLWSEKS